MIRRNDDSDLDYVDADTICHRGINCRVDVTVEQTAEPWDGDAELEEGSEGYDVIAEARCKIGGHVFRARASLCSIWIVPDREGLDYLEEKKKEVQDEALDNIIAEIARVGGGEDLVREAARTTVARRVATEMGLIQVTP